MTFEYLQRIVVDGELEVDNIGDCTLQATDSLGYYYFLLIRTELGQTETLEYGPIMPDIDLLPSTYNIKYNRFDYNQTKIERTIDKFLNDGKRTLVQASVVTFDEISEFLVNPVDKMFPTERSKK